MTKTVWRRGAPNPGRPDEVAARELYLYITSDGDLYRQQHLPIIKNLARKVGRGVYDKRLAVKLWMYLADEGARRYGKEFGSGYSLQGFDKPTRFYVAAMLARDFMDKYRSGEYTDEFMKLGKGKLINPAFRGGHLLSGGIDWSTDVKHEGDPNAEDIAWEKRRAVAAVMKLIGPDLAKWQAKTRFKFTGFQFDSVVWHLSAEQEEQPEEEQGEPTEPRWHYSLSFIGPAAMVTRIVRHFGGSWKMSNPLTMDETRQVVSWERQSRKENRTGSHAEGYSMAVGDVLAFSPLKGRKTSMKMYAHAMGLRKMGNPSPKFRDYPGGKVYGSKVRGRFKDEMQAERFMVEHHLEDGFYRKDPRTGEYVVYSYARNPRGLTRQGPACYASGMASRNPYTRVRFPAHSSRLFRSKKSGRWTPLPGRRKNPSGACNAYFKKGTRVGVSMWSSKPGKGLRYPPFTGVLQEDARAGGWDVYDMVRDLDGKDQSVYGFSLYRLSGKRRNPLDPAEARQMESLAEHHLGKARSAKKGQKSRYYMAGRAHGNLDAVTEIAGTSERSRASARGLMRQADAVYQNPRRTAGKLMSGRTLIGRKVLSVVYLDESKARRCGAKNPSIPWKHDFSSADAKVYGLSDGSVLIKSDKKKLWGYR